MKKLKKKIFKNWELNVLKKYNKNIRVFQEFD